MGFRKGVGTRDQIFNLRIIIEAWETLDSAKRNGSGQSGSESVQKPVRQNMSDKICRIWRA